MFSQAAATPKRRIESVLMLYLALVFLATLLASSARASEPLSCSDPVEGLWPYGPGLSIAHWSSPRESLLLLGNGAVLTVFDASDPSNLTILGEVSVSDPIRRLAVSADGRFVAVSDRRLNVHLVDIINRAAPQARGSTLMPDPFQPTPEGLAIVGNRLYVANPLRGVGIFDISDPDDIRVLGSTPTMDAVFSSVAVRGDFAYLTDPVNGITVVALDDPGNPTVVGGYAGSTRAYKIVIEGSRAYVTRSNYGFDILDLTDPIHPALIGNFVDADYKVSHLQLLPGKRVLVAGFQGSAVVDLSNQAAPVLLGGDTNWVNGMTAIGNVGFTITRNYPAQKLNAVDFSNPLALVARDSISLFDNAADVRVAGSLVLVANGYNGLGILDLADPQAPVRVGGYTTGYDNVTHVEWINGHAVIASFGGKLEVLDVSNPAAPQVVSTITESGSVLGLDREGNRLFAAFGMGGLRIYDFSNPVMPALLETYQPPSGMPIRVAVQGTIAAVGASKVNDHFQVHILDVSNPASVQHLSELTFDTITNDLSFEGSYLYVATSLEGVRVIDVSVPSAPVEVSDISVGPNIVNSLAARGNQLYAASSFGGLRTFDIGLPSSPMLINVFPTPGEARSIDMANDTIAIADAPVGVRILSCANAGNGIIFKNGFDQESSEGSTNVK